MAGRFKAAIIADFSSRWPRAGPGAVPGDLICFRGLVVDSKEQHDGVVSDEEGGHHEVTEPGSAFVEKYGFRAEDDPAATLAAADGAGVAEVAVAVIRPDLRPRRPRGSRRPGTP